MGGLAHRDVLRLRLKTMGVVEHNFTLAKNTEFCNVECVLYDVEGAQDQRPAWVPCLAMVGGADVNTLVSLDSQRSHFPHNGQHVRLAACKCTCAWYYDREQECWLLRSAFGV